MIVAEDLVADVFLRLSLHLAVQHERHCPTEGLAALFEFLRTLPRRH